ncbi:flagellum-specific ATP synthase FliI [Litorivita pollutaquae]|uniref:Flagellum-specific ATP synthase FliI n=1 Tax=Litorivita pollutaquae TaxID=2200892 RepID=A0A2V4MXZ7_9RHOB|nr:FliI/YscN family ATPase [Litorivita pollutaquae]PYC47374.1 flagellum-specific ATP synthase FliI [Litorivita pollutaquae]
MNQSDFDSLTAEISTLSAVRTVGRICAVEGNTLRVSGLGHAARMGDQLQVYRRGGEVLGGEVLQLAQDSVVMLPDAAPDGVSLGDRVALLDANTIAPSDAWIGRIIDPYGKPLDGAPLMRGARARALRADPPAAATRRAMGERLETGMAVFNTLLPVVRGQRVGLFAGSGVGKSSLLAHLARNMQADVVVIALVGERGRELRDFVENVLGEEGMKRSVVIAATSDRSPLVRRRCAWTAMSVAEHFRDQGKHVLFLADSITRFAEAHREVAVASGEAPSLRGYPPSTAHTIMSLCERAGPGAGSSGDITAVLSVLVAGSDMEEPIADILRGVLDGHVVLDRKIAERGRYPAVDLLRSVSRSLPDAASPEENASLTEARQLLGAYAQSEMMIRAGLYSEGSDPMLDSAIKVQSDLDAFLAEKESQDSSHSFSRLQLILRRAQSAGRSAGQKRSNVPNRAAPSAPAPRQRASGGALTVNPAVRGASGGQLPAE